VGEGQVVQRWLAACLLLLLAGCLDPLATGTALPPPAEPPPEPGEEMHRAPVPGTGQAILIRLCRPEHPEPVPLVLINHGSPASAARRPDMRPASCRAEPVRWFTARGYAVALPLRRGYGATGGAWAETFGRCDDPDFRRAGQETARDIAAAIDHVTRLPGIQAGGVVVAGQSAGGWGALALAAEPTPEVAAVVNMAGGRGGWARGIPNTNCRPERLIEAAAAFGRTARLPTLWVYTANDSFFAPPLAAAMHRAFVAAGGAAQLALPGAWGTDGHDLFFGRDGSLAWGPLVEGFLRARGLPMPGR
jgi:dienelactone hydrolase